MPSLKDILEQTLVVLGLRGAQLDPFASERFGSRASGHDIQIDPSGGAAYQTDDASVLRNRIWSWRFDEKALHRFEKLAVLDRHMNYRMNMTVCEAVEFGMPVKGDHVFFADLEEPSGGTKPKLMLPLTADFLLAELFTAGGSHAGYDPDAGNGGTAHFWPLEANLDASLLLLFGYEVEGRSVKPIPRADADKPDFMPGQGGALPDLKAGETGKVKLQRPRIVVCVSLVCCKERADFEPGQIVGMARFYPHVMTMANVPLTGFEAQIHLERPASSPHGDDMLKVGSTTPISNILVTDTNQNHFAGGLPSPPPPMWDDVFDYYEVDDTAQFFGKELKVVSDIPNHREQKGLVNRHSITGANDVVHKQPRQGAFDSIHVAPRMAAPTTGSNAPVVIDPKFRTWKFDKIAMAPFCFHDCMHTHLRWGALSTKKINRGWDASFNPCKTAGAPMVPHNQVVFLRVDSESSFTYRAVVSGTDSPRGSRIGRVLPVGAWQLINSHGSAYAIAFWPTMGTTVLRWLAQLSPLLIGNVPLMPIGPFPTPEVLLFSRNRPDANWWMFYWLLRYRPSTALFGSAKGFEERIEVLKLADAMNL